MKRETKVLLLGIFVGFVLAVIFMNKLDSSNTKERYYLHSPNNFLTYKIDKATGRIWKVDAKMGWLTEIE